MTCVLLKHENLLFHDKLMFQTRLYPYECLLSWLVFFSSTRTLCSVIRSCSRQDSTSMNVLYHDLCSSQAREPSVPWYAHVPDKTLPVWMSCVITCVLLKHENLLFRDTLMFQTRLYQYECLVSWLMSFSSTRTFCFVIHSCSRQDFTSMNVLYHDLCSSQAREPSVPWYAHVPDNTLPVWMSCVITCVLLKHKNLSFRDTLMFQTRLYQYECLVSLLVFFSSTRTFCSVICSCSLQHSTSVNVLYDDLCSSQAREPSVPWYTHVPDKTLPVWMSCVMTCVLLKHENLLFRDTLMFQTNSTSMNVLYHDLCSSQAREPFVPW